MVKQAFPVRVIQLYRYYRGVKAPKPGWNDYRGRPRRRRRSLHNALYYARKGYTL